MFLGNQPLFSKNREILHLTKSLMVLKNMVIVIAEWNALRRIVKQLLCCQRMNSPKPLKYQQLIPLLRQLCTQLPQQFHPDPPSNLIAKITIISKEKNSEDLLTYTQLSGFVDNNYLKYGSMSLISVMLQNKHQTFTVYAFYFFQFFINFCWTVQTPNKNMNN